MVGQIQSASDLYAQFQSLIGLASSVQPAPQSAAQSGASAPRQTLSTTTPPSHVADAFTLMQFERARVTYQEQRTADPAQSYAFSASLAYERIAYSQTSAQPVSAPAPDASAPALTDAAAPSTQDSAAPLAATALATDAPAPSADTSSLVLHHVVINATTVGYRQLTHVVASPAAWSNAATPVSDPAQVVATDSAPPAAEPAIKRLSLDDFASLRSRTIDHSRETTLALKLTTREGDLVELTFRQLDLLTQTRLKSVTDSGDRVRASDTTSSSQRYVHMQITGDLSDAEKSAIDSVLQSVVDVANQFFHGDLQAAIARLSDAQIDTSQLADVSLKMSMSQSLGMNRVTLSDDGKVQQLAHRDSVVSQALEFLADQQRALIAAAKTRFEDRSAVNLVKQLLPALIAPTDQPMVKTDTGSADGSTIDAAAPTVDAVVAVVA